MHLFLCIACVLLSNNIFCKTTDDVTGMHTAKTYHSLEQQATHVENKKNLIRTLYKIGAIQTGDFILKSGIHSPIYFDMRLTIAYPKLLGMLANEIIYTTQNYKIDLVCGVPHAAVPLATLISAASDIPMIMPRKEIKAYGTQKAIEGFFKQGDICLVCEDVITSGASILETVKIIEDHKLHVTDIIVLIDREQGGRQNVEAKGYRIHALWTISDILQVLLDDGTITAHQFTIITDFCTNNRIQ